MLLVLTPTPGMTKDGRVTVPVDPADQEWRDKLEAEIVKELDTLQKVKALLAKVLAGSVSVRFKDTSELVGAEAITQQQADSLNGS